MPTQPRSEERTHTGFTMSSWAAAHAGGFQFVLTNFTPFWAACPMGIKFQHHQTEHNFTETAFPRPTDVLTSNYRNKSLYMLTMMEINIFIRLF